jgi:signal recognition particle subunit SRP54
VFRSQVLDATLKEITAALLESDVNVKLVSTLRQKVKAKVKSSLESTSSDGSKEVNKKNFVQKVHHQSRCLHLAVSQTNVGRL